MTTINQYEYNKFNQISKSTVSCSDGSTVTQKYLYPLDISSGLDIASINKMKAKNIIYPYIERVQYRTSGEVATVMEAEYLEYAESPVGVIKPVRVDVLRTNTIISLNELFPSISGSPNIPYRIAGSPLLKPDVYFTYNSMGNIMETRLYSGKYTAYLWSYCNQYPIAKLENASFNNLIATLGSSTINAIASKVSPSEADFKTINSLRNNTSLNHSLIYTYKYNPTIGITSETDPSGRTVSYEYDDSGRLKQVEDENDKILSKYQYNYGER